WTSICRCAAPASASSIPIAASASRRSRSGSMPLLKHGEIVADPWQAVGESDPLPADAPVIVPYKRWQADREALLGRNAPLGVRLTNTQDVAALAPALDRFGAVVLEFPAFKDGRAYSQARLLRERYNFKGELRAAGNVLRDQLMFMH